MSSAWIKSCAGTALDPNEKVCIKVNYLQVISFSVFHTFVFNMNEVMRQNCHYGSLCEVFKSRHVINAYVA